jgi:hypothetical protein
MFSVEYSGSFVENKLWEEQEQKQRVSGKAVLIVWLRNDGCMDECGTNGGGDVWSKKGHVLQSEPTETACIRSEGHNQNDKQQWQHFLSTSVL